MANIPQPTYERDIETLVKYFRKALAEVESELLRMDITDFRRANAVTTQKQIRSILDDLDKKVVAWTQSTIPKAVENGIVQSMLALEVVNTVEDALKVLKFNRLNKTLIDLAIADTQADLLQITQNIERKTRIAVRQAMSEVMRSNMAEGVNGVRTIRKDFLAEARKLLGDSINTGIVDASNRRWKPEVYADMVTRTKLHATYREATVNDALEREALYGVISRHGALDDCRHWEGKVVKFVADAPGSYPYIGDLPRREIFHPNCRHHVSPIRNPERA
jgi:hypothetical protein